MLKKSCYTINKGISQSWGIEYKSSVGDKAGQGAIIIRDPMYLNHWKYF